MKRRLLVSVASGITLGAALPVLAQTPKTPQRIGVLNTGTVVTAANTYDAFRRVFKELGWIEGRDYQIDVRYANGDIKRMDGLIAELLAMKPDLILAGATNAALAAQRATRNIPIVFGVAVDPVADGLVASLAKPGGNITGLSSSSSDLTSKRLQLLKECIPMLSRVAVLIDPTVNFNLRALEDLRRGALLLGVSVAVISASSESEIEDAFPNLARERFKGLYVLDTALFYRFRQKIATEVTAIGIPAIYGVSEYVDEGGLMAYGVNYPNHFGRTAIYVDKILKGARPADLPVEQPTTFELVVNTKTARSHGIKIPQAILLRADRVIE